VVLLVRFDFYRTRSVPLSEMHGHTTSTFLIESSVGTWPRAIGSRPSGFRMAIVAIVAKRVFYVT